MARRNGDDPEALPSQIGPIHLISFDSEICGGYLEQFSFPSQPPDIRSWFSSYRYESPESPVLPEEIGGSLQSQRDEIETQDPSLHAVNQKIHKSSGLEDEFVPDSLGIAANREFTLADNSVLLKAKQSPELEFDGKSDTYYYGSDKVGEPFDNQMQSPKKLPLPVKMKCKEQCSDQKNPRMNLKLPTTDAAQNHIHEGPFPNCVDQKDGFISTRRSDDVSTNKCRNIDNTPILSRNNEQIAANKENHCNFTDNLWSRTDQSDALQKSSTGTGSTKLKKKQSLRHVLGEEFLVNYKEDVSNVIPTKSNTNTVKFEHKENIDAYTEPKIVHEISPHKQSILASNNAGHNVNDVAREIISVKKKENSRKFNSLPLAGLTHEKRCSDVEGKDGVIHIHNVRVHFDSPLEESYLSPKRKEGYEGARRSALADKTNVQAGSAAENLGKWQCPRKNKPYMGPPMKQLRMDNWLRRVN